MGQQRHAADVAQVAAHQVAIGGGCNTPLLGGNGGSDDHGANALKICKA
jgi:hypothetical protein